SSPSCRSGPTAPSPRELRRHALALPASGVATPLSARWTFRTAPHAISASYVGARHAGTRAMHQFASLERCAAYVSARSVLTAVQRTAPQWPEALGRRAHRGALDTLQLTAQAAGYGHDSAGRRHCLREAITT